MIIQRPTLPQLIDRLREPGKQFYAVQQLGSWFGPRAAGAISELIALYDRLPSNGRGHILPVVCQIGPGGAVAAVPWLIRLMRTDPQPAAIAALCSMGPAAFPAIPELLTALLVDDDRMRVVAAEAIGAIGPAAAAAVPALEDALADPEHYVRVCAQKAIRKINGACPTGDPTGA